jgi:hypothetical protein
MKPSRTPWVTNVFPLIDTGLSRDDCNAIMKQAVLLVPRKSACVFCLYHDDCY